MKHCLPRSREIAMYHSAISEEVGHGHEECMDKDVKTVPWAAFGQFLAIGSFNEKLRVLNHLTWRAVAEHPHPLYW